MVIKDVILVFGNHTIIHIINRYHQEYDPIRNGSMDGTDINPHDHGLQRAMNCHCNFYYN